MILRNLLRTVIPESLLTTIRRYKKTQRDKALKQARLSGDVITKEHLISDLRKAGIDSGDTLLVHASLSKIGYVDGGAGAVVEALLEVLGPQGNLLMPTSPNAGLQLNYIRQIRIFDVANTPSALGAITEYFRKLPGAKRSAHPTEPVSCVGPDASFYTATHFGEMTPYTSKSPFYKVSERKGKILYLGVTFDNAGTNLHTLEDAVASFVYPVYYPEIFDCEVVFEDGTRKRMQTKVHNPEQSAKRKCDGLIPLFREKGILHEYTIGKAPSLLVDAEGLLEVMIREYKQRGVTMYTPLGND